MMIIGLGGKWLCEAPANGLTASHPQLRQKQLQHCQHLGTVPAERPADRRESETLLFHG